MSRAEDRVDDSIAESLVGAAGEGAEIVGVAIDDDAGVIVKAINHFLQPPKNKGWSNKPKIDSNIDNWTDRALPIGSLWGLAMVRHFGWHWASLTQNDQDDSKAIAIVSPNRSLAIFPFHYCFECLESHAHPTILLTFNMLEAGTIPPQAPGEYVNMMDKVMHIIPPT